MPYYIHLFPLTLYCDPSIDVRIGHCDLQGWSRAKPGCQLEIESRTLTSTYSILCSRSFIYFHTRSNTPIYPKKPVGGIVSRCTDSRSKIFQINHEPRGRN